MTQTTVNSIKNKRILLSPLNWGLGHVCRTIPLIQQLTENENEVIICCDDQQETFYRNYFPSLWYIPFKGYPFQFSGEGAWEKDILSNFSTLYHFLTNEKRRVADLVDKFEPDLLISDQRFGFLSPAVKSVIISHQLNLPTARWNFLAKLWNRKLLAAFDEIWIPDSAHLRLSGDLSAGKFKKKKYIGICSRFTECKEARKIPKKYAYLGIVSGPKPYNQQLLKLFLAKFSTCQKTVALIVPKEISPERNLPSNIQFFTNLCHAEFTELMDASERIVSRCGYTTIMDLYQRQQPAILIPTPGQKEQVYLAELHNESPLWDFVAEEELLQKEL